MKNSKCCEIYLWGFSNQVLWDFSTNKISSFCLIDTCYFINLCQKVVIFVILFERDMRGVCYNWTYIKIAYLKIEVKKC